MFGFAKKHKLAQHAGGKGKKRTGRAGSTFRDWRGIDGAVDDAESGRKKRKKKK
jgi:hypothetical protein